MKEKTQENMFGPEGLLCTSDDAKVVREFLAKIGDKWSILVIVTIARSYNHKARFSELQRMINGISQRMLTTTLRYLERDGFVTRTVFPEVPPRVEYELTDLGLSILVPMQSLVDWIASNWSEIKKARQGFDKEKD
ncbi:winged helix-turn-helix transcriptional regulator [Celerinatantimonas sp. MCCC 1A17872]|uniref:winged helix-turn-helix transcriptional regulator n=1 Tax=Celerinatantimonas sp. MCCC 1A17872 TaxID=3177514 RepID=UPI0038C2F51B